MLAGLLIVAPGCRRATSIQPPSWQPPNAPCLRYERCGDAGPCFAIPPSEVDGGAIQAREVAGSIMGGLALAKCWVDVSGKVERCRLLKPIAGAKKAIFEELGTIRLRPGAWCAQAPGDAGMAAVGPMEVEWLFKLHVHAVPDADVPDEPPEPIDPNAIGGTL
jgi:hypothetical protein